jgi:hypothetical protein
MFCVNDSTAEAIRRAYDEGGELSAVVELRRHFPGIADQGSLTLYIASGLER